MKSVNYEHIVSWYYLKYSDIILKQIAPELKISANFYLILHDPDLYL